MGWKRALISGFVAGAVVIPLVKSYSLNANLAFLVAGVLFGLLWASIDILSGKYQ